MDKIIKLWKKLNIDRAEFQFDCGGDSMGSTEWTFYDNAETEVRDSELESYFEDEVYRNVDFYENSDGHYQGEAGTVEVRLDEGGTDFEYYKSSQSEYNERHESVTEVELTEEMLAFIKAKVLNINGSQDQFVMNYKGDCILTDKDEQIASDIEDLFDEKLGDYSPSDPRGELGDWYTYTTNERGDELEFDGNSIRVQMSNEVTVYTDSEN